MIRKLDFYLKNNLVPCLKGLMIYAIAQNKVVLEINDHFI